MSAAHTNFLGHKQLKNVQGQPQPLGASQFLLCPRECCSPPGALDNNLSRRQQGSCPAAGLPDAREHNGAIINLVYHAR